MSATRSAALKKTTASRPVDATPTFVWQGTDKHGMKLKGEQTARNANLLRAELRRQGITPTVVKPKSKPLLQLGGGSIKSKDMAFFSRQLATMMKSGVPIVGSLEIIADGVKKPRMKAMVNQVRADIEGGSSLYEAISKHPQFDDLFRNLVRAGEGAGVLETVLDTIASYKESIETLKGKVKKALFYPIMVIAVSVIVTGLLLWKVVPQFADVFSNFGAELPALTRAIIAMSNFVAGWGGLVVLLAIVGAVVGIISIHRSSPQFRNTVDRAILKVPVIGKIMEESSVARFARTTAVTFGAGVPLVEGLGIVAGATGNKVYEEAVLKIRDQVAVGYSINMAMRQQPVFPHMVVQMTSIGEEAGALDTMLYKVAEYYEQEVNNSVDALSSLLEPMIMVFIGALIGTLVIAMYLPIFKLAGAM